MLFDPQMLCVLYSKKANLFAIIKYTWIQWINGHGVWFFVLSCADANDYPIKSVSRDRKFIVKVRIQFTDSKKVHLLVALRQDTMHHSAYRIPSTHSEFSIQPHVSLMLFKESHMSSHFPCENIRIVFI